MPDRAPNSILRPLRRSSPGASLIGFAILLSCSGCVVSQPRGDGSLERVVEPSSNRGYWRYLPKAYLAADDAAKAARRWPLVVTFHGMKPFDNAQAQALEWESEADRYGFLVIAPELRAPDVLAEFPVRSVHPAFRGDESAVIAILDHVFATTRADPSAVLSTSWSSGGYMAHYMMNRHPDRFTCLAVRQSNFSASILDPNLTRRAQYHPVLILNTQNDFAICKTESKQAVQWYGGHGYRNVAWVHIKDKGHERTPDLAADFFARFAAVQPSSPPKVLVNRQAIDGNPEGIAFLQGKLNAFERPTAASRFRTASSSPPAAPAPARPLTTPRIAAAPPVKPLPAPPPSRRAPGGPDAMTVRSLPTNASVVQNAPTERRASAVPSRPTLPARTVDIRVSSAIGIEPLLLGFSAECPSDWLGSADFLWTLNGQPIGSGVNGQQTIDAAGEHTLSLLIVTDTGEEYRRQRTIRVLPRLASASAGQRAP